MGSSGRWKRDRLIHAGWSCNGDAAETRVDLRTKRRGKNCAPEISDDCTQESSDRCRYSVIAFGLPRARPVRYRKQIRIRGVSYAIVSRASATRCLYVHNSANRIGKTREWAAACGLLAARQELADYRENANHSAGARPFTFDPRRADSGGQVD